MLGLIGAVALTSTAIFAPVGGILATGMASGLSTYGATSIGRNPVEHSNAIDLMGEQALNGKNSMALKVDNFYRMTDLLKDVLNEIKEDRNN